MLGLFATRIQSTCVSFAHMSCAVDLAGVLVCVIVRCSGRRMFFTTKSNCDGAVCKGQLVCSMRGIAAKEIA